MNKNQKAIFPTNKKRLQDILAINVSPIKVDNTPDNVVNKFKIGREIKTGISDFNPFDLIESTDTSKGQRDSNNQLRRSQSCANSPTRYEDPDLKFKKAVGKFISGYSFVLALNEDSNEDGVSTKTKEILSEGTVKQQRAYRYSQGSEEDDDDDFDCEWPKDTGNKDFFSETKDLRRSKSYNKHILIMDQYQTPTGPSGPQYNVYSGGTVKHSKVASTGSKQRLSAGKNKKQITTNIARLHKIESTYAKTDRKNAHLILADQGKKKKILVKPIKRNQIIKKESIAFKEGPGLNDGQDTVFRITRRSSKKALGQKAFTTGNRVSEGTDDSVKQSPNPQFQEFAQTAYAFELKNALQNPDTVTGDLFDKVNEAAIEDYQLPSIHPKSISMKHAKNQFSGNGMICEPTATKQAFTNQVSKRNLLSDDSSLANGSEMNLSKQHSTGLRVLPPTQNLKVIGDGIGQDMHQKQLPMVETTPNHLYTIKKKNLKLQGTLPKIKDRHAINRELLQKEILKFKQKIFNVQTKIIENTQVEAVATRQKLL